MTFLMVLYEYSTLEAETFILHIDPFPSPVPVVSVYFLVVARYFCQCNNEP